MSRPLLHIVLALTLILNGISAPWAMARMDHGDHGASGSHVAHEAAEPSSAPESMAHHGHHDHTGAAGDQGSIPDPLDDGNCCDGTSCQCGCVFPPVLALRMLGVTAAPIGVPVFVAAESHLVRYHTSPPLRPPAA
ncbi:MAG: CopL family metal-binding regulatory protein [Pseudomarimonas sp.]